MSRLSILSFVFFVSLPVALVSQCATGYATVTQHTPVANSALWFSFTQVQNAPDGVGMDILSSVPMNPGRSTSIVGVWGFDIDIPCNATIDNISFNVTRRNNASAGSVVDENLQLRLPDFTLSPVNGATATTWSNSTTTWETFTYNPGGTWGTTLTPDIVNDHLFGLVLSLENASTTEIGFPEIDAIELEVCYTVVGTPYPTLEATITSSSDNLCDPVGNAAVTINATGGSGSYEYSIDGGTTWSTNSTFSSLASDTYFPQVRNDNMTCELDLGPLYLGCNDNSILQVGDAIYSCLPTPNDPVTLAIDRTQPLSDFYSSGQVGVDVSPELQQKAFSWTAGELGGSVFGVTFDDDRNIYTGVSSLYNLITAVTNPNLLAIDAATGIPTVIATVPGNAGIGQLDYQSGCDQLFVVNLDDGIIYRYDTNGTLLSTFDPLTPDDGVEGLADLGERIVAVSYNYGEDRLYYSVWSNDGINNGTRNSIRSVAIDPATCDFVPSTDILEITMPYLSETEGGNLNYSMPVVDIEFDQSGGSLLIAESGFNSTVPVRVAHRARIFRYDGMTTSWSIQNTPPAGNDDYQFEIGSIFGGTNALGGVDFSYAGMSTTGCVTGEDSFIVATGDALLGTDCNFVGCIYGLQYMPVTGGNPTNSVLLDLARSPGGLQKGFFGDVDVVNGCCPCACPNILFDITVDPNNICQGDATSICVENESGGSGPYTYLWSSSFTTACINETPTTTTTYSATVTDSNGCSGVNSIEVVVSPTVAISNVTSVDNTDCSMDNGSITITASGGTAPLEYSIDNGVTYQSSNMFSSLGAGTYSIVVQDASNCTATSSATLAGPGAITISNVASVDNTDCSMDNGGITITASGGTAPLQYSIDNGVTYQASNMFSGLGAGTYSIVVQDASNCTATSSTTLAGPGSIAISNLAGADDTDCSIDNGSITVSVSGGVAPVEYSIDNGMTFQSGNVFNDLGAGTYSIVVRDANNCTASGSATLDGAAALNIASVDTLDDTDCEADNGSITINVSSGAAPIMYSIDGGTTFGTSNVFNNLSAGSYDIAVEDNDGCTAATIVMLSGVTAYSVSLSSTDDTDCDRDNGSITISVTGGTAPIEYSIDGGLTFGTSNAFSNLSEGTYTVVTRDASNCAESTDVTLAGPPEVNFTTTVADNTDCTIPNGSITINATGGVPPYMYSIDGGLTFQPANSFSNLLDGTYNVLVSDSFNCTESDQGIQISGPACGGTIGDRVWEDLDGNGQQDPGEPGVPEVRVELYNHLGNLVSIDFTDSNGNYSFEEVFAGEYYIRFDNIDDFIHTTPDVGGNDTQDSDVDDSNGPNTTPIFTQTAGEIDSGWDLGLYKCVPVGELVWLDVNENGMWDNNENGINGLKVELYKNVANLWIKTDITYTGHKPNTASDDGYYKFCVSPGQYYLKFNNPPDRLVRTRPNQGTENRDSDITDAFGQGTTDAFTVNSGDERCDVGAGFVPAGSIGDFVWVDDNGDGIRGAGERGLQGVDVMAINSSGMIAMTTTDEDGQYLLDLLPEDQYYLQFSIPEGYTFSPPNLGDDSKDSDVDDSNGPNTTPVYNVTPGDHVENVDAGVQGSPLPVTWVSIDAASEGKNNSIEWVVATEKNVSHYEVEHAYKRDSEFSMLDRVYSDYGTYQGLLTYSYQHTTFGAGLNYYRVKQVDLDGRSSYSDIVSVRNSSTENTDAYNIKVFPNPVLAELNIGVDLIKDTEELVVNLYDNLGQKIAGNLILDISLRKGYRLYTLDVTAYPQGVYSLEIIIDNDAIVRKIAITE